MVRSITEQMTLEQATIKTLRRWSQFLLWIAVLLPILGAITVGARYYVERRANQLSTLVTEAAIQKARQDATTARNELAQFKQEAAPRKLSDEQRNRMLPLVAPLKGHPIAFACRMMDGESCDFATDLATFFLDAGCQVPEPIKTSLNDLPGYLAVTARGNVDPEAIKRLLAVFIAGRIPAKIEVVKENSMGAWYNDAIYVVV